MAEQVILIDTSILIDYFRKTDKANSKLISLLREGYELKISSITEFENYVGATGQQQKFWEELLESVAVLPFDKNEVKVAVEINVVLKRKRQQIDIADLFIAATAISNNLPFATLNTKHFDRINTLKII